MVNQTIRWTASKKGLDFKEKEIYQNVLCPWSNVFLPKGGVKSLDYSLLPPRVKRLHNQFYWTEKKGRFMHIVKCSIYRGWPPQGCLVTNQKFQEEKTKKRIGGRKGLVTGGRKSTTAIEK